LTTAAEVGITVYDPTATASEVHYTFTGPTSVAFDWRGGQGQLSYGPTSAYGSTVTGQAPNPMPWSSAGPFYEAAIAGLQPGTTYHYAIDGGVDHTFTTAPTGNFRFAAMGDIGSSLTFSKVPTTMNQVAADAPAFVLMLGDLTYANTESMADVDQHFEDVRVWSDTAAYMPVWGNHDREAPDDLRNYKGRFALPNPQTSFNAPSLGCCGEDWSWFDAGGVRFIAIPEPYETATWTEWQTKVGPIMAAAQADPNIRFIVTFGHRPAYSTGTHPGSAPLAAILDGLGDTYSKYVLDLNGHSHAYERYAPIHGVVHITDGVAASVEGPWSGTDPRTAFRALHLAYLRIDVTATSIRVEAVCGAPSSKEDTTCALGSVLDSVTIGPR
jgi:hypothetical protein